MRWDGCRSGQGMWGTHGYLEHDVAVSFIELAVESLVHQSGHKVLDLPDTEARQLPHILAEEL